jgi:hypothetical protein
VLHEPSKRRHEVLPMGRRRRRAPKKPTVPHPPLWPYLAAVAGLLLVVAVLGTRHVKQEQARMREMVAEEARRRATDSIAQDPEVAPHPR